MLCKLNSNYFTFAGKHQIIDWDKPAQFICKPSNIPKRIKSFNVLGDCQHCALSPKGIEGELLPEEGNEGNHQWSLTIFLGTSPTLCAAAIIGNQENSLYIFYI